MAQSIAERQSAPERNSLADVCGKPIKAGLHPQVPATNVREVAAEARARVVKLESAADEIGIHPARLSHKFTDGTLTLAQIERLGPTYAAELGRLLVEQFAPLATPAARIRKLADEQERIAAELRQLSEYVA